jgi:hypothetical protein
MAADMACNDTAIRPLVGDTNLRFGEHKNRIVWPEDMKFAPKLSMEEYFLLLLKELEKNDWHPDPSKSCDCSGDAPPTPDDSTPEEQEEKEEELGGGSGGEGEESDTGEGEGKNTEGDDGEGKSGNGSGGSSKDNSNPHGYPNWFQEMLRKKPSFIDWMQAFDSANQGQINRALRRAHREVRKIVRTAVRQTEKSRGTVPGAMESILEELLSEPTIPWSTVLFGLVKHEISSKLAESTAYPNVSLLHSESYEPYPGYQNDFTFTIVAAFDTSGSMSDAEVMEAYSELQGVLATEDGVTVRLVHFDAALQYEAILDEDNLPELQQLIRRYGHGGTDFEPPLRYVLHQEEDGDWLPGAPRVGDPLGAVDMVLLFTDGGAPIPFPELEPSIPFWWVLTTQGYETPIMRNILHIEN